MLWFQQQLGAHVVIAWTGVARNGAAMLSFRQQLGGHVVIGVWGAGRQGDRDADSWIVRPGCNAPRMVRSRPVDRALVQIWRSQCDLITRSQALAGGMTE